jgi:hypothetical protein
MRPLQFGGPVMQTSLHWAWAGPGEKLEKLAWRSQLTGGGCRHKLREP